MYKSAEPYWPYVNTAYYLGRFALGANPLALGTWWFVGNLGSRGAQAIAQHMAALPVALTYREFPGAHEIRPAELAATVAWLDSLAGKAAGV